MNIKSVVTIIYLIVVACENQNAMKNVIVEDNAYRLTVEYRKESEMFDLSLQSIDNKPICVPEMLWMDDEGNHYFNRFDDVYVVFDNTRFDLKSQSEVYCTPSENYDCIKKLMPGEEIVGKIYLRDFEVDTDELSLFASEPILHFPLKVYRC